MIIFTFFPYLNISEAVFTTSMHDGNLLSQTGTSRPAFVMVECTYCPCK